MTLRKIFTRLFGGFALISAFLAAVTFLAADRSHERSQEVTQMFKRVSLSEKLQIHLLSTNREWFLFGLTGGLEHRQSQIKEEHEVRKILIELKPFIKSQADNDLLIDVTQAAENYLNARAQLVDQGLTPPEAYQKVNNFLRAAHTKAAELARLNLNQASIALKRSQSGADFVSFVAIGVLILYSILLPIVGMTIKKWIYRPIRNLNSGIVNFMETQEGGLVSQSGITEIREVAEAFNDLTWRLADQKKNQLRFLAGVAHDLKNPLSGIKMSAQILDREDLPPEKRKQMIDVISRQTDQLGRMIGDFLDASHIESGHLELVKSPRDLRAVVSDSVILHRQVSQRHMITLNTSPHPVNCDCDLTRITQVINNLLSNAIKYSPNGGEIKVDVLAIIDQAIIRVSDEGIGISKKDKERVFEAFHRTKLTKKTIPGVGLGLSVSKHIVEQHGGKIEIESQPGVGSTFIVKLPLLNKESSLNLEHRGQETHGS